MSQHVPYTIKKKPASNCCFAHMMETTSISKRMISWTHLTHSLFNMLWANSWDQRKQVVKRFGEVSIHDTNRNRFSSKFIWNIFLYFGISWCRNGCSQHANPQHQSDEIMEQPLSLLFLSFTKRNSYRCSAGAEVETNWRATERKRSLFHTGPWVAGRGTTDVPCWGAGHIDQEA